MFFREDVRRRIELIVRIEHAQLVGLNDQSELNQLDEHIEQIEHDGHIEHSEQMRQSELY